MLLVALVCYINTQIGKRLVYRNGTYLNNNSFRQSQSDEKNEINIEVPENVDGVAVARFDDLLGYFIDLNLTNETTKQQYTKTLWSRKVPTNYICGSNNSYTYSDDVNYKMRVVCDSVGCIIVAAVSLCLYAVFTATWPILISISHDVSVLNDKVDDIAKDVKDIKNAISSIFSFSWLFGEKKKDESETKKKVFSFFNLIKFGWMALAAFLLLFVTTLVAQLLCVQMGWRNMRMSVHENKCFFIDKTGLSLDQKNKQRSSLAEKVNQSTVTPANFVVQEAQAGDGKRRVIFTSGCEDSQFVADDGTVWRMHPSQKVDCTDIDSVHVKHIWVYTQRSCTFGGWEGDWTIPNELKNQSSEYQLFFHSADKYQKSSPDWLSLLMPWNLPLTIFKFFKGIQPADGAWKSCKRCCGFLHIGDEWKRSQGFVEFV